MYLSYYLKSSLQEVLTLSKLTYLLLVFDLLGCGTDGFQSSTDVRANGAESSTAGVI